MNENVFDVVLDKDEKIEKVFKPNKAKKYLSGFCAFLLFFIVVGGPLLLMFIFPDDNGEMIPAIFLLIPAGILIVAALLCWWFLSLSYKNTYYAWTNKRILIRHGVFGVDYKSLDLKMIGAISVSVTLIDKLLKKNTGSISFGSMASQLNAQSSIFVYANVVAPYDVYKEIKSKIDEYKVHNDEK